MQLIPCVISLIYSILPFYHCQQHLFHTPASLEEVFSFSALFTSLFFHIKEFFLMQMKCLRVEDANMLYRNNAAIYVVQL